MLITKYLILVLTKSYKYDVTGSFADNSLNTSMFINNYFELIDISLTFSLEEQGMTFWVGLRMFSWLLS